MQIATEKSGWKKPLTAGQGRGIAVCNGFGSFMARVVQVTVDKSGEPKPTHVWCVADCEITVNASDRYHRLIDVVHRCELNA